jgi:hypothetical protein
MNITNAQYVANPVTNENASINIEVDGHFACVPIAVGNRYYDEIMRQVEAGTLTIADAE